MSGLTATDIILLAIGGRWLNIKCKMRDVQYPDLLASENPELKSIKVLYHRFGS